MRNNYLLGLGGALLATTSLSGMAQAASLKADWVEGNGVTGAGPATFAPRTVAAQLYGTGGVIATTTIGALGVTVQFTNTYGGGLKPNLYLQITGATFSTTSLQSQTTAGVKLLSDRGTGGGTLVNTLSGASGCTVGVLQTQIQITGCNTGTALSATAGGATNASFNITAMVLSGLVFSGTTGLTTTGAVIQLTGFVADASNLTNTYETLAATTVVTSANSATVTVGTATATVQQGTGATPFVTVSQSLGNANATAGLTVELAAIYITGTGAFGTDLTTAQVAANAVGALALTVTSAVLADPAISNVRFMGQPGTASIATSTTLTSTATFANTALTQAVIYNGANAGTNYVQVEYNGTTSLTGGAAGTIAGTFSVVGAPYIGAVPALAGSTSAVNRGGFNTQINNVQATTNTAVQSYVRITNGAAAAGAATVTVYNAGTGASMGSYTTASIPGFATLQLAAKDIETGAGITPTAGLSYDIVITGPLNGYAQHVTGNPGGLFVDFSGRRQSIVGTN